MARIFVLLFIVGATLGGMSFVRTENKDKVLIAINENRLEAELANTREEHMKGLSGREFLPEHGGMLFAYEQPVMPEFWMKDMKFPIDIVWIGADKKIVEITENISPETFPQTFKPKSPIQYALELNARWADNHEISIGDKVVFELDF